MLLSSLMFIAMPGWAPGCESFWQYRFARRRMSFADIILFFGIPQFGLDQFLRLAFWQIGHEKQPGTQSQHGKMSGAKLERASIRRALNIDR